MQLHLAAGLRLETSLLRCQAEMFGLLIDIPNIAFDALCQQEQINLVLPNLTAKVYIYIPQEFH